MKYKIEIDVTTDTEDHNSWKVILTSRIETDITTIVERSYPKEWEKADAALDLIDFISTDNFNWS